MQLLSVSEATSPGSFHRVCRLLCAIELHAASTLASVGCRLHLDRGQSAICQTRRSARHAWLTTATHCLELAFLHTMHTVTSTRRVDACPAVDTRVFTCSLAVHALHRALCDHELAPARKHIRSAVCTDTGRHRIPNNAAQTRLFRTRSVVTDHMCGTTTFVLPTIHAAAKLTCA